MNLTAEQRKTILAAFLGWTLDAFDFFLLTFLLKDIAKEFGVDVLGGRLRAVPDAGDALRRRLHLRPHRRPMGTQAGADARHPLLFDGRRARRVRAEPHGLPGAARPVRHRDGRRMGPRQFAGDGVDSRRRRAASCPGILQCGYPSGFPARRDRLRPALRPHLRRLYRRLAGDVPAQRPAGLRRAVHPLRACPNRRRSRRRRSHEKPHLWATITEHKGLVLYMVVLMMCFNLFSHGTQDLYPTFLQKQHNFDPGDGELDHHRRQSRRDRRRPHLRPLVGEDRPGQRDHHRGAASRCRRCRSGPLRSTPVLLALGAFVMQVAVQGAWGVIPAHLNELSPARRAPPSRPSSIRPAISSPPTTAPLQAKIAEANGGNYGLRAGAGGGRRRGRDRRRHPLQPGAARRASDGPLSASGPFRGSVQFCSRSFVFRGLGSLFCNSARFAQTRLNIIHRSIVNRGHRFGRSVWVFLAHGRFAANAPAHGVGFPWILSLNRAFSMGYAA